MSVSQWLLASQFILILWLHKNATCAYGKSRKFMQNILVGPKKFLTVAN